MLWHETWRVVLLLAAFLLPAQTVVQAKEACSIRLLTENEPPFNFPGEHGPQGFTVDVVRELQERTGTKGQIIILPWARAYAAALTEPDTGLFTVSRIPERDSLFQWVGPVMVSSWGLYARPESNLHLKNLEDARQLSGISVYRSDVREEYLRQAGFVNLHTSPAFANSVRMMLSGRVPVVVAGEIDIDHQLQRMDLPPETVERVLTLKHTSQYIAFSLQTEPELVRRWQQALEEMHADGTLARLHARWLPAATLENLKALPALP